MKYLDIKKENNCPFAWRSEPLKPICAELEDFLAHNHNMDNLYFAKKMLFSHELKANNQVEGYKDELSLIEDVIHKKTAWIKDEMVQRRILNLYRGYQYILKHHKVDKYHLRDLYQILSSDLLEMEDLARMGEFYRQAPVYILKNNRIDIDLDEAVSWEVIPQLMDYYFAFFSADNFNDSMTDNYLKSQILHFYFVYIHPYFDVNGRTSRTMALWYLLKCGSYPYIIFNRGIGFAGSAYDRVIRDSKYSGDLTYFLKFMLLTVQSELEKESMMQTVASNSSYKLTGIDYQTLLYFLTMNGNKTVGDFVTFYNRFNDKKKKKEIFEEMLLPLIDANILTVLKYTQKMLGHNFPNMFLEINSRLIPDAAEMHLKRLKINQSSKK